MVRLFKGRAAAALRKGGRRAVWQKSFYDHMVRKNEDIRSVLLYLLENPIRMGLVKEWRLRSWRDMLTASFQRFSDEQAPVHSAAIAYSMVFSLPPILLIILWTAGLISKESPVRDAIAGELGALVGTAGAQEIMASIQGLVIEEPTWWATTIAAATLLFTASTVLVAGQGALNRIFRVKIDKPKGLGVFRAVRDKLVSFAMLTTIALLLSVSLVLDATAALFGEYLADRIGALSSWVTIIDVALIDLGAMAMLFAMLFRYLPDAQLDWNQVWFGALLTAGLFAVGKTGIGFVVGQSRIASLYDAAGSILVFMLWVYYASGITLFGACVTAVRAGSLPDRQHQP